VSVFAVFCASRPGHTTLTPATRASAAAPAATARESCASHQSTPDSSSAGHGAAHDDDDGDRRADDPRQHAARAVGRREVGVLIASQSCHPRARAGLAPLVSLDAAARGSAQVGVGEVDRPASG
jgi:hypothetical protein